MHEALLLGETRKRTEFGTWHTWKDMPIEEALELTRDKFQPGVMYRDRWNPEGFAHSPVDPAPDFARRVRTEIENNLGLPERSPRLRYYTGVDGPVDSVGVDCWFEYTADDGQEIKILVDHTENPDKDNSNVDYIMLVNPDRDMDNGDGFERFVGRASRAIVQKIEKKQTGAN